MSEIKLTKQDRIHVFLRSNLHQGSWNFERMQALGYCYAMIPAIKRLYQGEDRKKALKRHLEFFNTQPFVTAPILGVNLAMEEQKANGADIDDGSINGLKVGLMGPLAGVGDPIFGALICKWTTVNIPFVLAEYTAQDGTNVVTTIQSVLDSLLPGLIPLLMTFGCMKLLKKKVNPLWIIFGLFGIGIIGYVLGILA